MPIGQPFKFAGSYDADSNGFRGGGFNGLPLINEKLTTVDISQVDDYIALTGPELCKVYWNLAGMKMNARVRIPIISQSDQYGTYTNLVSINQHYGEVFYSDNDDGEGYEPQERVTATPGNNNNIYFEEDNYTYPNSDTWTWRVYFSGGMRQSNPYRFVDSSGAHVGYGMDIFDFSFRVWNGSIFYPQEFFRQMALSSVVHTKTTQYNTWSTMNIGDAQFIRKDRHFDTLQTTGLDAYLHNNLSETWTGFEPIFFDY